MGTLQQTLDTELGRRVINQLRMPDCIVGNLNPAFSIRPYQIQAFRYYLNYFQEDFDGKPEGNHHLLFHMATGSGKTLLMAGALLHLYEQGHRNFLFFVNNKNIIDKTRNNFLDPRSGKYLFAPQIEINGKKVEICEMKNFQSEVPNAINVVFETIQGLHSSLNSPRENAPTYDDFERTKIVLIADEAHHINAETKKGGQSDKALFEVNTWEKTVRRIFEANPGNVLLDFTATVDFADKNLAEKYKPKLIFDYSLKEFRKDQYSKEVKVLQASLPPFDRALQAVLLSQYRRKIFEKNSLNIKPVILLKSKTIKESQQFLEKFAENINALTGAKITKLLKKSKEDAYMSAISAYLTTHKITPANFAAEIKEEFSRNKLLEINSAEESVENQIAVNTLEDKANEYRAIFAVDKLNEGWDVLNLFDIVRLYETRDSGHDRIGKTTMSEAQLIGRGARYCPFQISPDQQADKRKYDEELDHELRVCEELVYHSFYNRRYIQELNNALHEVGIKPKDMVQRKLNLKDSFKETKLYKKGFFFLNERVEYDRSDIKGLNKKVTEHPYEYSTHTGQIETETVFEQEVLQKSEKGKRKNYKLIDLGENVLREAAQRISPFYDFSNLQRHLPNLPSLHEFLTSDSYMGCAQITIRSATGKLEDLSQDEKLHAAQKTLKKAAELIASDYAEHKGTKEFKPFPIRDKLTDKILNFSPTGGEFGKSMNSGDTKIPLNLSEKNWYVYDDSFGTDEEKRLIVYIDGRYDELADKYAEVYLIRNERAIKIYAFDDGKAFEPDFVLYLIGKDKKDTMYYQIFIEPKGKQLLLLDEWKENFLLHLKEGAKIKQLWSDRKYAVWGLPFYNQGERMPKFKKEFNLLLEK